MELSVEGSLLMIQHLEVTEPSLLTLGTEVSTWYMNTKLKYKDIVWKHKQHPLSFLCRATLANIKWRQYCHLS